MFNRFRRGTPYYALIQGLYWAIYCLMVGFASVFLLDRGFTSGQIGLILGISYLLSAILQPLVGSAFYRWGIRLHTGIGCAYIPVAAISLAVLLFPMDRMTTAVLMAVIFTIQSVMQPSVNALHQSFEEEGRPVNFSLARGVGSAAYALSSFAMGRLLTRFSPSILPGAYGAAVAALIIVLFCVKTDSVTRFADLGRRGASYRDILRAYPTIGLFLAGVGCMFLTFSFIDNFLVQIIMSIGGNSGDLGTAITLSAITELPAMLLFARFCRKGKGLHVYMISIWVWLAKDILTLLAPNTQTLFVVQLLNFASCAIYVPGMMEYVKHVLPEAQLLRGVTMAGTSTTLGSLIAMLLGGWLIDAIGVRNALLAVEFFAAGGTVMLTLALRHAIRNKTGAGSAA